MAFCNPDNSPYLVIKGLRALKPLDNVLVRVRVLSECGSLILDMSLGCLVCHDFLGQCYHGLLQPAYEPRSGS